MEQDINQRGLIFLLLSIGLITLPHLLHIPVPIMVFFFILFIWRFVAIWRPAYLPHRALVFLLLLSGIGLLVIMHQGVFGRDAGTAVFVVALGLKLLEIKKSRDVYLISYLAFIVAASQFLYLQNILMAAYILLVSISLCATLICMNSQSMPYIEALKTAGRILLQALPLMMILFVFFPRAEAPRWSFLQDSNQAKSGLSDTLEPGSISRLGLSAELVFRAKFTGAIPPNSERYWRGPVFSYTDGKQWRQSKDAGFKRYLDKVHFSGQPYHYKILMEPQAKNWVFALDMPATFEPPLYENAYYQLLTSESPGRRAEYQISSYVDYNTGYLTKTEYINELQIPAQPDPRISQLITQLGGFSEAPETFIKHIFRHFRQNDFYYTLMPPLMQGTPIETFLFDARAGFCGHYASAFVYLLRVAGIPARIVSGYQGGEYNQTGGFIEVRQANAHAWAEVWLAGKGWVRYDPATAVAPERVEQDVNIEQQIAHNAVSFAPIQLNSQTRSWLKQARSLWGTIDYSWHRWVINYDRQHQLNFLSGLLGIKTLKMMLYWLLGLIAGVTLLLGLYLFRQPSPSLDKAQLYYVQACRKLAKTGLLRQDNEGAEDFLQRVSVALPQIVDKFAHITRLYVQIRYGRVSHSSLLSQLKAAVSEFQVSVKTDS